MIIVGIELTNQQRRLVMPEHPQQIQERLLQSGVSRIVGEELGRVFKRLADLTKDMSDNDRLTAKRILLEAMQAAASTFFTRMKLRIECSVSSSE